MLWRNGAGGLGWNQRPSVGQQLLVGLLKVDGVAMGLRDLEAGLVVKLNPVAFRVEEVHAEGITVADDPVNLDALLLEPMVMLSEIVNGRNDKGNLLDYLRAFRGLFALHQNKFMMFPLGIGTQEAHAPALKVLIGNLQPHYAGVEISLLHDVIGEDTDMSQTVYSWHYQSSLSHVPNDSCSQ